MEATPEMIAAGWRVGDPVPSALEFAAGTGLGDFSIPTMERRGIAFIRSLVPQQPLDVYPQQLSLLRTASPPETVGG